MPGNPRGPVAPVAPVLALLPGWPVAPVAPVAPGSPCGPSLGPVGPVMLLNPASVSCNWLISAAPVPRLRLMLSKLLRRSLLGLLKFSRGTFALRSEVSMLLVM